MKTDTWSFRLTWLSAGFFWLVVSTGCQTTPQQTSPGVQLQHLQQQQLYRTPKWEVEGKIAVRRAEQRQNASFKWSQQHNNYVIHLFGPFGQGTTWLRRTSRSVTLENAQTGVRRAKTAEELMQTTLGWQVPVSNLEFWLRGLPAKHPIPTALERDPTGFLTQIEQQGWQVVYSKPQNFNGWWLPTKIVAERDDLFLTVIIKNWSLPTAPTAL